ncbi:hypothetical protein [Rhodococcus sp. UNC23MFCrub1.1]|uniref:hypothetical protein n=1 Tax=Rhodococcus sp. UNC23MFCrub1.1 TaxID=1449068 RepID=UPI000689475D|nr:hypothetical protein [Rhodococcus sp. UNC23MFCrub1.1]
MSAPDAVWRRLSPMVAARRSMRLYDAAARSFTSSRALTSKRPLVPAAVPLFAHGRARVLALDFDAKMHGAAAVEADVARVLGWLTETGGRAVVDISTSGGRHVLVPLAPGVTAGVTELRPLLNLLAARLPTLDIVPMTNAATGCITVPGSACREGGHRHLIGDLATATDTLTIGSEPAVLTRLAALLGGLPHVRPRAGAAVRTVDDEIRDTTVAERVIGKGRAARLHSRFCRTTPPPAAVRVFAATGRLDRSRWASRSEARQSVIAHAVLSGNTADDIAARLDTPEWAGVRDAYAHYGDALGAVRRDTARALEWAASSLPEPVRHTGHKLMHTGGGNDPVVSGWLAAAQDWAGREYASRRDRWSTHAVLQALAWGAATAGEVIEGVPVVALGGRSLSTAAGLLPETTVWSVLARLRDTPGSPVLLIARGVGQNADRYALVPPRGETPSQSHPERQFRAAGIDTVHPAWSVVGYRHRVLYDAVAAAARPMTVDTLLQQVRIGRSSGYDTVLDLRTAGLLTVTDGYVQLGDADLDDIAHRNGLAAALRSRTVRHRAERVIWRQWLAEREAQHIPTPPPMSTAAVIVDDGIAPPDEGLWDSVMADEPRYRPDNDPFASLSTLLDAVDPITTAANQRSTTLGA